MIKDKNSKGWASAYRIATERGINGYEFQDYEVDAIRRLQKNLLRPRNYSPLLYGDVKKDASLLLSKFAIELALGDLVYQGKLKEIEWNTKRGRRPGQIVKGWKLIK